jgi:hypothetical protein
MNEQLRPEEAASALAEVGRRQEQVIDAATLPNWYWWTIGGLMVVLAAGVDAHRPWTIAVAVPVFVLGVLAATGYVTAGAVTRAQLRNGLLDGRGAVSIVVFVAVIVGVTLGIAFALRAAGVPYPATQACLVGALGMGAGGPMLMRYLRNVMLGNRIGSR